MDLEKLVEGLPPSDFIRILIEIRDSTSSAEKKLVQLHKTQNCKAFAEELAPLKYFLEGCPYVSKISLVKYHGKDAIDDATVVIDNKSIGVQLTISEKEDEYKKRKQLAERGWSAGGDSDDEFIERLRQRIANKRNKATQNTILIIHANTPVFIDDLLIDKIVEDVQKNKTEYKEIWITSAWRKVFQIQ